MTRQTQGQSGGVPAATQPQQPEAPAQLPGTASPRTEGSPRHQDGWQQGGKNRWQSVRVDTGLQSQSKLSFQSRAVGFPTSPASTSHLKGLSALSRHLRSSQLGQKGFNFPLTFKKNPKSAQKASMTTKIPT